MAEFKKTKLEIDHKFDQRTNRHYLNGVQSVYHCHHYTSLYTQLAIDAGETELLQKCAEESFFNVLSGYFESSGICNLQDRIEIACQYFSAMGLGVMEVNYLGDDSGEIELPFSLLDEGWKKKWGNFDKPVNYIGAGYMAAMFSAIMDKSVGDFAVLEVQSIVQGKKTSVFKVVKK